MSCSPPPPPPVYTGARRCDPDRPTAPAFHSARRTDVAHRSAARPLPLRQPLPARARSLLAGAARPEGGGEPRRLPRAAGMSVTSDRRRLGASHSCHGDTVRGHGSPIMAAIPHPRPLGLGQGCEGERRPAMGRVSARHRRREVSSLEEKWRSRQGQVMHQPCSSVLRAAHGKAENEYVMKDLHRCQRFLETLDHFGQVIA